MGMTDSELYIAVCDIDFRKKGAHATPQNTWILGKGKCAERCGNNAEYCGHVPNGNSKKEQSSDSAQVVAECVDASQRRVEQIRTIRDHAPNEVIDELKSGAIRIAQAYQLALQAKRIKRVLAGKAVSVSASNKPALSIVEIFSTFQNTKWYKEMDRMDSPSSNCTICERKNFLKVAVLLYHAGWIDWTELEAIMITLKLTGQIKGPDSVPSW